MNKTLYIDRKYLNIPVYPGGEDIYISISISDADCEDKLKIFEFTVPVNSSDPRFYAQIPVSEYNGKTLLIEGDFPEEYSDLIFTGSERQNISAGEKRPVIHFTADSGWTNDPNGLIYDNGVFHFYFQYNPFNLIWGNMTWGHAVSSDLLHWEYKDSVMFPDQYGTMYSGCAVKNDRALLNLPEDAIIFFYTAAGGMNEWSRNLLFTQKIAFSTDGGETLQKTDRPCLDTVCHDNRDPKVYWHEETGAYIMVLWLKDCDFGIFRSEDLLHWNLSDRITLEDGWECPDILELHTEDGESFWFFWTADGYYYTGDFDGYHFRTDGRKHCAYLTALPYAAQTYSGTPGRVISIPWLRTDNDGRSFTGTYGIPVELSCEKTDHGPVILQKPVRELMEHAEDITDRLTAVDGTITFTAGDDSESAFVIRLRTSDKDMFRCSINGNDFLYVPYTGELTLGSTKYRFEKKQKEFFFIIDDTILELFSENMRKSAAFSLTEGTVSFSCGDDETTGLRIYKIR